MSSLWCRHTVVGAPVVPRCTFSFSGKQAQMPWRREPCTAGRFGAFPTSCSLLMSKRVPRSIPMLRTGRRLLLPQPCRRWMPACTAPWSTAPTLHPAASYKQNAGAVGPRHLSLPIPRVGIPRTSHLLARTHAPMLRFRQRPPARASSLTAIRMGR